jgi:hypothetical protein
VKSITIYGHSDDCIEVDGAFSDEGYVGNDDAGVVLVTARDGLAVFRISYGEWGVWRVVPPEDSRGLTVKLERGPDVEGGGGEDGGYTDRCTVTGDILSVSVRKAWPPTMRQKQEDIEAWLENRPQPTDIDRVWSALTRMEVP